LRDQIHRQTDHLRSGRLSSASFTDRLYNESLKLSYTVNEISTVCPSPQRDDMKKYPVYTGEKWAPFLQITMVLLCTVYLYFYIHYICGILIH